MSSMMLEAALRSLFVALAVAAGLRLLRVRNVPAQKAAWTLVLFAALAMPLLLPIAGRLQILPAAAMISLPEHPLRQFGARLGALWPRPAQPAAAPRSLQPAASYQAYKPARTLAEAPAAIPVQPSASFEYNVSTLYQGARDETMPQAQLGPSSGVSFAELAWLAYLCVTVTLLFRLFVGLASALLIWMDGVPIILRNAPHLAEGLSLRASREVSSPVTIGSAVVLPADYADWDIEKLRIVLAHERSHIRQGDFYLQFLASLYAALVWFSPLGWWLKSKLSDLAETISDHAGLEQAADCSSYAQVLLEFAAAPRPTLTGVAMARPGSLSRRIERLLNASSFSQAFVGGKRRIVVAVLVVPTALFAATSLIRVQAASQSTPPPAAETPAAPAAQATPPAQPAPEAPITGQAAPEPDVDSIATPSPDQAAPPPPAKQAPRDRVSSGVSIQAPQIDGAPVVPPAPPAAVAPLAPGDRVIVVPRVPGRVIVMPKMPKTIVVPEIPAMTIRVPNNAHMMALMRTGGPGGYAYYYSLNGESYGIVRGNGEHIQFSGDLHSAEIDKIRKLAHGDFLWFERDGKYYFVDDPATVAQIEAMYKPIDELGKQQEELGRKQEELGKQQEALGRQQEQAAVPTPDISKEMAELNAAMAKLQAKMGKTVTQDELADLEGKLGDLQGRLGEIQGEIGAKQGSFGAQQGKLGQDQGRLGAEQGRLGAEQGRLATEVDRKVKSIIDQSLQNGKAHPVQ